MKKRIAFLIVLVLMVSSMGVFADKVAAGTVEQEHWMHNYHGHTGHDPCKRTVIDYSCGCKKETVKCCCGELMSTMFIRCFTDAKQLLEGLISERVCDSHKHCAETDMACETITEQCYCGVINKHDRCCSSHSHIDYTHVMCKHEMPHSPEIKTE